MGFLFGGYIGAKFALPIDDILLRRIFGVLILLISINMIIGK